MSNPIDDHVRLTLRMRRKVLGISLEAFAEAIGAPVEQVRALERGHERISASVLFCMARALDISLSELFEGFARD